MMTMELFKRTCRSCGRQFMTTSKSDDFCSADCSQRYGDGTTPAEELLQDAGEEKSRKCLFCGSAFEPESEWQLYCGTECSEASKREDDREKRLFLREKYGLSYRGGRTDAEKERADMLRECRRLGITLQEAQSLGIEQDLEAFEPNAGNVKNKQIIAALDGDFSEGGFMLSRCKSCGKLYITGSLLKKHCDTCNAAIEMVQEEKKRQEAEKKRKEEKKRAERLKRTAEQKKKEAESPEIRPADTMDKMQPIAPTAEEAGASEAADVNRRKTGQETAMAPGIKAARKQTHLKQRELAEELGVDMTLVSRYETGKMPVPMKRLEKMAGILGVDTEALLEKPQEGDPAKPNNGKNEAESMTQEKANYEQAYDPCKDLKTEDGKHTCDRFRIEIKEPKKRCCKEGCPMYKPAEESEEIKRLKQENEALRESVKNLLELTEMMHKAASEAEAAYSMSKERLEIFKRDLK